MGAAAVAATSTLEALDDVKRSSSFTVSGRVVIGGSGGIGRGALREALLQGYETGLRALGIDIVAHVDEGVLVRIIRFVAHGENGGLAIAQERGLGNGIVE